MRNAPRVSRIEQVVEARLDANDVGIVIGADPQDEPVTGMIVDDHDRGQAGLGLADVVGRFPLHLAPEPVVVGNDEAQVADLG